MEFEVNYKAIKETLGLSFKQTANLLGQLAVIGAVKLRVEENNGYRTHVELHDLDTLLSLLSKKMHGKGLKYEDLGGLSALVTKPVEEAKPSEQKYSFLDDVKDLKLKYPSSPQNRYFKHFNNGHKRQFFATIAARLEKGKFTLQQLDNAFQGFANNENYSLSDILSQLDYAIHEKLIDFLWIQTEGKVANVAAEGKAAKDLAKWIETDVTTFEEIEDCWVSLVVPTKYNPSLISLKKALQVFSKDKTELEDGRFGVGTVSLYNNLKTSIDNLKI